MRRGLEERGADRRPLGAVGVIPTVEALDGDLRVLLHRRRNQVDAEPGAVDVECEDADDCHRRERTHRDGRADQTPPTTAALPLGTCCCHVSRPWHSPIVSISRLQHIATAM